MAMYTPYEIRSIFSSFSTYVLVPLIVAGAALIWALWKPRPLDTIPTVGASGPLSSYFSAIRFMFQGWDMIQEGYLRFYDGGIFKIPMIDRYMVVVVGRKLSEELRSAPEDVFSLDQAMVDMLHLDFVFGKKVYLNPIQTHLMKTKMTKAIAAFTPELYNETVQGFEIHMPLDDSKEWKAVPCLPTCSQLSTIINNRIVVGNPLCRDPEYIKLNLSFIVDMFKCRMLFSLFPRFLEPLVGQFATNIPSQIQLGMRLLKPVLDERTQILEDADGDWSALPDDMLSWLMESVPKDETLDTMTRRLLGVNVAAIHTIAHTFSHGIFYLASNKELIAPIRKEVEDAIAEDGWTKTAMGKLYLLDSFLKEVLRFNGAQAWSLNRIALKDWTFSDGTFIPKGTSIAACATPVHMDETVYPDPQKFDAYRFYRMMEHHDSEVGQHLLVKTSLEYLPFGHGTCPGRFFAANQMKLMIGYLLLNYDIELETPGVMPKRVWFEAAVRPNPNANILYRKRQT
ncbi:cytochrome P450 [Neolentinus lepideus HHB14362 ss-1]|uniref:Cytochrome P450 n=1 Tax=Neolentinus lepideus HHB14362 ss-1 TaxID=1314782 RepID=A0A165S817_9AGAM|nr:cytochrome P450 [Neolentinus lepideus HHB14362 ss-1]